MVSRVRGALSASLLFLMLALAAVPVVEAHTRLPGSQIDRYILPGDAVFPEGIAYQPSTGAFFVSSTTDGTIYRGNVAQRTAQPFLPGNTAGRTTATGLKIDRQGRLFVCGAGSGLIFVYDTKTKALLAKLDTGSRPTTFINDVALTPSGDAYVTDSISPYLYRVAERAPNQFQLKRFLALRGTPVDYSTPGFKLNGIVATRDGRFLITVQSNTGQLFRIDLATKTIMPIDVGGATVFGDGLLLQGHTLDAVAALARGQPRQIVTLRLSGDYTRARIIAARTAPSLMFPTTIARARDRLLVVNAQFDKRGPGLSPQLPFTVSALPLPKV
jgi:Cu-Zn family superoxide dismutase